MNNVIKIGDMVRLPGFPALLEVEDICGALGTVCWKGTSGHVIRSQVFLSQLKSAEWSTYGAIGSVVETVPPPFLEENWHPPFDG